MVYGMVIFRYFLIFACFLMSLISINHLYPFFHLLYFNTFNLGRLGWVVFLGGILYLSRTYLKKSFLVFITFFLLGICCGPYLEPPGDPIDHLKRAHSFCGKSGDQVQRSNSGLWHYSMISSILCYGNQPDRPQIKLIKIDLIHGLFWAVSAVVVFGLSISAGLPGAWAFLSVVVAFLFFGTNKFSYFSYYSFAPSFSSIILYWLWVSIFFFKKNRRDMATGIVFAIILIPILAVNHVQESVFLIFIVFIWLCVNIHQKTWRLFKENGSVHSRNLGFSDGVLNVEERSNLPKRLLNIFRSRVKSVYVLVIFVFFFIVPQFEFFQEFLSQYFLLNDWEKNQKLVFSWNGIHLIGKIWSYRVNDTLGFIGVATLFFSIALLWFKRETVSTERKSRIIILGILPFIVYFVPFFHFIWVSNCKWTPYHIRYYYRICYSSMFWITISFFIFELQQMYVSCSRGKIGSDINQNVIRYICGRFNGRKGYFAACLAIILILSSMRSGPIYGKLDFISLDTRPWWQEWKPALEKILKKDSAPIFTDRVTANVISGIFDFPIIGKYNFKPALCEKNINIRRMERIAGNRDCSCLINLHGFKPSWVPRETGHWSPELAKSSRYYRYKGMKGKQLVDYLKNHPIESCEIYH
jgi:hypothetical protein